jgi:hypothetical protein
MRGRGAQHVCSSDYCGRYARRSGFRMWDTRMILSDVTVTREWL